MCKLALQTSFTRYCLQLLHVHTSQFQHDTHNIYYLYNNTFIRQTSNQRSSYCCEKKEQWEWHFRKGVTKLFHMAQRREKQQNMLLLIEVENICSFRDIRVVSQTNLIRKRKRSPQALQHDPRQASKQQTHTKY